MKRLKLTSVVLVMTLLTGCASIVNGPRQKVHFTSEPTKAKVVVHSHRNNKEDMFFTTPAIKELDRESEYTVTFMKDGYQKHKHEIKRGINLLLFGNAVIGGLIGIIIDMSTGAAYRLTPNKVHANLESGPVKQVKLTLSKAE